MTHFLQSSAWQSFQKSLNRTTFRKQGDGWEFLAILEHGTLNSRLYCPYGPSARDASAFLESLEALKQLGREQHVTFIRVEPENPDFTDLLATSHWKPVTYQQLQPTHSRVIDLTPSEDKLIAQMAQPVRNIYRNYDKKGISVHHSDDPADITILLRFVHEVAERTGIHPHSDQYFEKIAKTLFPLGAASLWYVTYNDTPIAAALFYDSSDTRIYAHAGASSLPEYRKLNASTALLAEAIMDAKHKKLARVDLYGIAPDNAPASHPWAGFTRFKRSFGREDVTFAGAGDMPLNAPRYWLYRAYQTAHRKVR